LKQRYRALIKIYHPDRHPDRLAWANQVMTRINEAYARLRLELPADQRPAPLESIEIIIRRGDEALRRAVIMGWLNRAPRSGSVQREILARSREELVSHPFRSFRADLVEFYAALFGRFLEATVWGMVRPLPNAWNSTRFFRDLRSANTLLDKGIRDFYHHRDRGRLQALADVPYSYLADAIRYYSYLNRRAADSANGEVLKSRIEIARAFQARIREPGLQLV
jgi:curved DNA-binding protein CbpA